MVHRDRLCLIDFQDARLGPAQYDLVSLLRDSYAELSDELMEEMVEYYLTHPLRECLKCAKVPKVPKVSDDFYRIYDFATVERNMHATACFAWLNTDCGVSRYVQYIPRTLGTMRRALARQPELARLRAILACYVEELA
jgi:aminoglycoside/choline kinase family phosphotransferase